GGPGARRDDSFRVNGKGKSLPLRRVGGRVRDGKWGGERVGLQDHATDLRPGAVWRNLGGGQGGRGLPGELRPRDDPLQPRLVRGDSRRLSLAWGPGPATWMVLRKKCARMILGKDAAAPEAFSREGER